MENASTPFTSIVSSPAAEEDSSARVVNSLLASPTKYKHARRIGPDKENIAEQTQEYDLQRYNSPPQPEGII